MKTVFSVALAVVISTGLADVAECQQASPPASDSAEELYPDDRLDRVEGEFKQAIESLVTKLDAQREDSEEAIRLLKERLESIQKQLSAATIASAEGFQSRDAKIASLEAGVVAAGDLPRIDTEDWGDCTPIPIGKGGSFYEGGDWCPPGSFITEIRLEKGDPGQGRSYPIIDFVRCCKPAVSPTP